MDLSLLLGSQIIRMEAPARTEPFPQPILLLPFSKARSWIVTFNKLASVAKGLGKHEVSHEGAFRVIASEAAPGTVIRRWGREAVHFRTGYHSLHGAHL